MAKPGRWELTRVHREHKDKFFKEKKKKKSKGCGEGDKREDRAGRRRERRGRGQREAGGAGRRSGSRGSCLARPYRLSPSREPNLK